MELDNGSERIRIIRKTQLLDIMEKASPFRLQKMIIHSSKELPDTSMT